jgi:AraC family transcriptional regulator
MSLDSTARPRAAPWKLIGRFDGLTVHEYRCHARVEDPPFTERHAQTGFALVQSGTFVYRRGRDAQPLVPGALLLGNAGDEYVCTHEYGTGDVCLSFAWSPERIDDFTRPRRADTFLRSALPPVPRVAALSRLALAAAQGESDAGIDEMAHALLDAVQSELDPPPSGGSPIRSIRRDRDRAVAAAEFIEANAELPLDLATIARRVGLSPFHFLRLFRHELGLTPHQHLIRVRIRRAIQRLVDTDRRVTDIALEVGFEDLSNFVRTFHRQVGWAPAAFRRKILQAGRGSRR